MKYKKVLRLTQTFLLATICFAINLAYAEKSQDETSSSPHKIGGYVNVGLVGDFALRGYDSSFVDREPRLGYQVEIGNGFFALPISFSNGQSVQIFGIKPRFQYLIPFLADLFLAGPGVGFVYNYWHSDFDLAGANVSSNVSELGGQISLQVMIRPLPNIHILLTPAAYDFNFWRNIGVGSSVKGLGNFSTTSSDLGVVYSAGLAVGFNF